MPKENPSVNSPSPATKPEKYYAIGFMSGFAMAILLMAWAGFLSWAVS